MALADIEGARIYLKQLTISHQMAGWESIQEILIRHYSRQLLHEMYKVTNSIIKNTTVGHTSRLVSFLSITNRE